MKIDGSEYDISREHLRLLIERDSPAAWIAEALVAASDDMAAPESSIALASD